MGSPIETIYDKKNPDGTTDTSGEDAGATQIGGSHAVEEVDGKFLLIGVENFNGSATGPGMSSYLRLGAAAKGAGAPVPPSPTGEDLASLVTGFADDTRNHGVEGAARAEGDPTLPPIQRALDEQTLRDGPTLISSDPVTRANRRTAESSRLHERGGWRDHSDGNRITTTRGDKVEVIRGNYKLLVLGRQSTDTIGADQDRRKSVISNGAGMDLSGGLLDTDSSDLLAPDVQHMNVEYTWTQNTDDMRWTWTQTTTVGDRAPTPWGNYQIVGRTWVDVQDTQLGSADKRVSRLIDATYADVSASTFDAKSISQTTTADSMDTTTSVSGLNGSLTSGGVIDAITAVGVNMNSTFAGLNSNLNLCGVSAEMDLGLLIALVQEAIFIPSLIIGIALDEHVGIHLDNHEGSHNELHTGMHTDMHTGTHFDTHAGLHMDVHSGPHATIDSTQIAISQTEIKVGDTVIATRKGNDITMTNNAFRSTIATAVDLAGLHIKS